MNIVRIFLIVITGLLVNACIWGEGSDATTVFYSGKTTPAEITDENGKEVAAGGISGQSLGGTLAAVDIETDDLRVSAVPVLFTLGKQLNENLNRDHSSAPSISVTGIAITESGSCGGSYTYNDIGDITSGNYRSVQNYDSYCEFGVTQSGKIEISNNSITISRFRIYSDGFDISMSGSMSFNLAENTSLGNFSYTANLTFRNNLTGETTRLEEYTISASFDSDNFNLEINGRIFITQYGYVDITTITPLSANYATENFTGEMLFTGNNSSVSLAFLGNGEVRITVNNSGRIVSAENLSFEDVFSEL